eukprot:gnl/MRDRNA2_/MRDRNA2_87688_c0_seq1.p1 gnl/MRDRNA2_/MRDRNA2_87688_c0~~gnl/MRDRNA2_/MRDRNA2_87688_c0_seq1.p1  ORF type:complete len:240 (+),score=48.74 gnl/MRDRNA2_/MRDRNA2_87688_c0_seq1:109-720(+)
MASLRTKGLVTAIAISGPSRSGKTRLATLLRERLGAEICTVLSQDAFWRSQRTRMVNGVRKISDEEVTCTDWKAFEAAVAKLISQQEASGKTDVKKQKRYVIIEGFQVLHCDKTAEYFDAEFHLDIDKEEVIARRSAAASAARPNPHRKPRQYCQEILWPAHVEYVERSVQGREGIHLLKAGDEEAFCKMFDDVWNVISAQGP